MASHVTRRPLALAVTLVLAACASGPGVHVRESARASQQTASPVPASPGDGVGDTLFPALGNPGIDVQHYDVDIAFDSDADVITGSVGVDLVLLIVFVIVARQQVRRLR